MQVSSTMPAENTDNQSNLAILLSSMQVSRAAFYSTQKLV